MFIGAKQNTTGLWSFFGSCSGKNNSQITPLKLSLFVVMDYQRRCTDKDGGINAERKQQNAMLGIDKISDVLLRQSQDGER
jgi:hypothetical protein